MTDEFDTQHPRDTTGRFTEATQSAPETDLTPPTAVWSPDPTLVSFGVDENDSSNYLVHLTEGGMVNVDLSRDQVDPEGFFDHLEIHRENDSVYGTGTIGRVDFTQAAPEGVEDSGEWLADRDRAIQTYLDDTYGVSDDNNFEWDSSSLRYEIEADTTPVPPTRGNYRPRLTASSAAIFHDMWNGAGCQKLDALREDLADDSFFTKLRTHLESILATAKP